MVIGLAREMRRSGAYEPIVLIADWAAVHPVWGESHGLRTVRWRIRSCLPGAALKERLAFLLWRWRFAKEFRKFCDEHAVAVVNPHYPGPSVFALHDALRRPGLASQTSRARPTSPASPATPALLLSFHGADLTNLEDSPPAVKALWQAVLPGIAGMVVCSQSLGRQLNTFFGQGVRSQVVYNGLEARAFANIAARAPGTPGRTVLNVGKFEKKKGQDVLIRAFGRLAGDHPDLRLSLVGAVADALPALQALCAELNLNERVDFHVNVPHPEVGAHFQAATVFVLPSRSEPFGIVLLEAGAFSLPVVASHVGGVPEIVSDGQTGLLVPPDDVDRLAQAIRSLLDDPSKCRALGHGLHERVVTEFTWATACRRYAALLGDSTGDNARG
ncbi:MAG: hypothetical protein JWQ88_834 [Rhodoferax sp.]|nr:hypothetical protein [Rhodoferax sp.]